MGNPKHFIAILAHELSHYIVRSAGAENAPGGEELHELLTDLASIIAGFGIFKLDTAFVAENYADTFSQGWRIGLQGYMPPEDCAYALALFLISRSQTVDEVKAHLSPDNFKLLTRAEKSLMRDDTQLRRVLQLAVGANR